MIASVVLLLKDMEKVRHTLKKHQSAVRFLSVGVTSLAVDYGILLVLYRLVGIPLVIATTVSYLIGLCVNFLLNKYWTFDAPKGAKQSTRQAILYAVLVGLNVLCINIFVVSMENIFHIGPELTKPIATAILTLVNFVAYQKIIFKTQTSTDLERSMM